MALMLGLWIKALKCCTRSATVPANWLLLHGDFGRIVAVKAFSSDGAFRDGERFSSCESGRGADPNSVSGL